LTVIFQSCLQKKPAKKKVVYVNSYHRGHPSSDEIMDAVLESFASGRYELTSFIMDTKRNPSQEYIERTAASLSDSIVALDPDILIVSDDNAVKYMVQPLVNRTDFPVVFCGVNSSDREYALPEQKVTGMLEILPVSEALMIMRGYYPDMKKLLVLSENTTTSRKEAVLLDTMYQRLGIEAEHRLVDNFDQWKSAFMEGNQQFDIIYVVTHGAIKGWAHDEAVRFVRQNIVVPLVTCEDFMMPYVVLGLTKVASEQGYWAAKTAKAILNGTKPSEIPVTSNKQSAVWLNSVLARKIGFQPQDELFKRARWWPVDPVEK
jgi:ABC-type uncharacterized transport system substrate-binding protein